MHHLLTFRGGTSIERDYLTTCYNYGWIGITFKFFLCNERVGIVALDNFSPHSSRLLPGMCCSNSDKVQNFFQFL